MFRHGPPIVVLLGWMAMVSACQSSTAPPAPAATPVSDQAVNPPVAQSAGNTSQNPHPNPTSAVPGVGEDDRLGSSLTGSSIAATTADPPARVGGASPALSPSATTRSSSGSITPTSAPSLVRHAFLGIVPDVTAAESTVGVLIAGTVPDSPAARAGVNAGDLLVQMDERPLHRLADLDGFIRAARPGDSCRLQLWRGKSQMEITATFGETLDRKIGGGPR